MELGKVAVRLQEGLLDQVTGTALGLQGAVQLPLGDAQQVVPAGIKGLPQGVAAL